MGSRKKKFNLSDPDDIKDLPDNPDLVISSKRKILFGEFKSRCKKR